MAMGLTGTSDGPAVEKPQSAGVAIDARHGLPIDVTQPADLRCPIPADQQHMTDLNGIFVQDQDMLWADLLHLKSGIPGPKRIRLRTSSAQMTGWNTREMTDLKDHPSLAIQRFKPCRERYES